MTPTLTIIIPTWNTCDITLKCIDTINKYLPKGFAQIIVVDNASTDNTQKLFSKIENITYIRNSTNLGFSKANNIGVLKATADYFLFLNSDMELVDSTLVSMVKYLKDNPQIGIIGPKFLNTDLTPQGSVLPNQSLFNAVKEFWFGIPSFSKYVPQVSTPTPVWYISGGALLISRQLFQKIKGWDERYYFYGEDLELCRQVRQQNKQIFFYPQCQVIHRHGASGTKVADAGNQWRRLIPSSKIYHGLLKHYLLLSITWSSQKFYRSLPNKI